MKHLLIGEAYDDDKSVHWENKGRFYSFKRTT